MRAPWLYMRSIRVGVNTRHSCTLESTPSPRDQHSKVQLELYLANVHSAAESTPGLVHMRRTCELRTQVWTLSSRLLYNISIWNQAYRTTQTRASAKILTVAPIQALLDRSATNSCRDIAYESYTEVFDDATSPSTGKQIHCEGAGQVIGDVDGFEHEYSNLCDDPWALFNSEQGFKLASWFIERNVSKSLINQYFSSGLGDAESVAYSSMHTLENHLVLLDSYSQYLQWFKRQVEDSQRTLPFFYRNVLGCVRYRLRQIAYRDDLVYAPRHEYDSTRQRIYAKMHTADWSWDMQVEHPSPTPFKRP